MRASGLWSIIVVVVVLVTSVEPVGVRPAHLGMGSDLLLVSSWQLSPEPVTPRAQDAWHSQLVCWGRVRRHTNPKRNAQRWRRRLLGRLRRQPTAPRARHRRRRARSGQPVAAWHRSEPAVNAVPPVTSSPSSLPQPPRPSSADPLAELRRSRGWIDRMNQAELWAILRQIRWPHGACCPHCGESDPRYLVVIDRDRRDGMYRYCCLVCKGAGDPGEGGTFTDLTGTVFEGTRLDIRSLWLAVEMFTAGEAAVETADEARVNRHTTQRLFRLLRGAIYQARPTEPIAWRSA